MADPRQLSLAPGRALRTRLAGVFVFMPRLARLRFDQLVAQAGYPASTMVPASSALLSLLAWKLLDKERHRHIDDFNFDPVSRRALRTGPPLLAASRRCPQQIRYLEETVRLRGDQGPIRQIAVAGLGHDQPTLFITHHFQETPREVIIRYAGRNRVEDGLGISVNCFHLDCLASEVWLHVDLDATLTVLANGCSRWLASRLRGYEKTAPKQLYRRFVETSGRVEIQDNRIVVHFDKRSHNPILREAGLDREPIPVPWLNHLPVVFAFP